MEHNFFEYKDNFAKYKHIKSNLLVGETENIPNPKITIAIPTYRRSHLIKDALNSAINQIKFENYEVIVIDNEASQEENETERLIKQYNNPKILYYKNKENIGMFGNWNRCIELARGEYVTILNDDDWLDKKFLFYVLKEIKENQAIHTKIKICDYREKKEKNLKEKTINILKIIYEKISMIKKIREFTIIDFFYLNRGTGSLGILFHRESLLFLGGYNEEYFPSSDYYLHTYYCQKYGAKLLKRNLSYYRIQENESMKMETIIKWPIQGFALRKYIIENFIENKKKYGFLNEIITEKFKKDIAKIWNIDIPYNKEKISKKYALKLVIREVVKNIF